MSASTSAKDYGFQTILPLDGCSSPIETPQRMMAAQRLLAIRGTEERSLIGESILSGLQELDFGGFWRLYSPTARQLDTCKRRTYIGK
jgi:hypothetical protein